MNLKQLFRSEDTVAFQVRLPSRRAACRPAVEGSKLCRAASSVHACVLSFGGTLSASTLTGGSCPSAAAGGVGGGVSKAAGPCHHYGAPVVM